MKKGLILILLLLSLPPTGRAQDMRLLQIKARRQKEALIQKARAEKQAAEKEAAASRARIMADRDALLKALAGLESACRQAAEQVRHLESTCKELEAREKKLNADLAETGGMIRELVGVIRTNAKDIDALVHRNLQTALEKERPDFLGDIAGRNRFPGMDDIRKMAAVLQRQIKLSGQVSLQPGAIIDRSGRQVQARVLTLGPFTAAYRLGGEVGFLSFSPAGSKLYALSKLPPRRIRKQLAAYMDGKSEAVPIDISRGAALRNLTHRLSLWEQIPKGGPIVWPILAIFALGLAIVAERTFFLLRRRTDGDTLMTKIEHLARQANWPGCLELCHLLAAKPLARVLAAGLECRQMERQELENALQEAILKEAPPMERFLSTLGMLAAIAPLLGLLGTVTGMIDTFHVITMHGTGDPRLMSGGISEALVTTMLGLSVAIPLMLAQTVLNRTVDNNISQLEEKAVALVNVIHKYRDRQ